mgnify:CR=1 FL=1
MEDKLSGRIGVLETKVSDLDVKTKIMERDFIELKATTTRLESSLTTIERTLTKISWASYGVLGTIVANYIGLLPFIQKMLGL